MIERKEKGVRRWPEAEKWILDIHVLCKMEAFLLFLIIVVNYILFFKIRGGALPEIVELVKCISEQIHKVNSK